jgi:hypothetical protein
MPLDKIYFCITLRSGLAFDHLYLELLVGLCLFYVQFQCAMKCYFEKVDRNTRIAKFIAKIQLISLIIPFIVKFCG